MDLVEVSPMAKPPVCKIMDYGKFKYLEKKKQNEAKKKQVVVQLKEVKLRPRTEEHDYDVKIKKVREFLGESNKARITVMFRGREMSHKELGQKVLQRVIEDLRDVAVIEATPRVEGRQMFMILAPNPRMLQAPARPRPGAGRPVGRSRRNRPRGPGPGPGPGTGSCPARRSRRSCARAGARQSPRPAVGERPRNQKEAKTTCPS